MEIILTLNRCCNNMHGNANRTQSLPPYAFHRSYGELGNAELVKKYGFALRQNPFTTVCLDKAGLLEDAKRYLGAAAWRRRSKLLRDQTEVLEEDEEPFEVRASKAWFV